MARTGLIAAAIAAGWLVLAGSAEPAEVVVAVLVGVVAATGGARLRRYVGHVQAGGRLYARHLPRMLAAAYRDCWILTTVLVRRSRGVATRGRFRWVPYQVGGDEPHDVGRRVLSVMGVTLQPNTYVVVFDPEGDRVLIHELEPSARDTFPPELRGDP